MIFLNIFKRAIETYDNYEKIGIVGEYGIAETLFAPKYHVDKSGDTIEVSISMSGEFIDAKVEKQAFIIPVTLLSEFRTSNNEANPFSDELQYVAPLKKGEAQAREEKHEKYMNELKEWALSPHAPEKVQAVYKYMEKETLCDDLVTKKDFSALGSTNKLVSKYKKYYVLWRVVINPQNESNKENYISECWKDKNLFKQYIEYYSGKLDREYEKEYFTDGKYSKKSPLCMITGERKIPAIKHKKISGSLGLISSNDTENFTYLGRFTDDKQALSIGYEASQKAHNALRWIYNNFQQTIDVDASTKFVSKMICWSPQPKEIDEDDYRHAVLKKPATMRAAEIRNEFDVLDEIVIAIMSQTSKGRFALVYYNDLNAYEYANRIENWDKWCSWNYRDCGIQNPSLEMIVRCAMGSEKQSDDNKVTKERFSINSKILKNERFHLLQCRLDGRKMPYHIVRNLYENASNPLNYSKEVLDYLGYVACAVIRKYRYDYFKEEWSVQLDMECKNRNYLWGRMLALLEKAEKDTYSEGEGRVPYAIQHQMAFSKKPYSEFKNIQEHWRNAYYGKLKYSSREFYDKAMTEIMVKLYEYPENEWNKPLDETYLMGYYCQRKELYTKKEEKKDGEENIGE